jgi:uncharacterized repeat protein (TIGR04076 family)
MSQGLFTTTVQPVIIARSQYQSEYSDYRRKIGRLGELLEKRRFMSPTYRVWGCVKEVRGSCAMSYKPGDGFAVERFYICEVGKGICIHALSSMLTLLSPFLKGVLAKIVRSCVAYIRNPYTYRGTAIFRIERKGLGKHIMGSSKRSQLQLILDLT